MSLSCPWAGSQRVSVIVWAPQSGTRSSLALPPILKPTLQDPLEPPQFISVLSSIGKLFHLLMELHINASLVSSNLGSFVENPIVISTNHILEVYRRIPSCCFPDLSQGVILYQLPYVKPVTFWHKVVFACGFLCHKWQTKPNSHISSQRSSFTRQPLLLCFLTLLILSLFPPSFYPLYFFIFGHDTLLLGACSVLIISGMPPAAEWHFFVLLRLGFTLTEPSI